MTEETLTTMDLFKIIEERRMESEERNTKLHQRIGDLRDELYQEIEKSHTEIMYEIREMKEEQRAHAKTEAEMLFKLDQRISEIEKWRWLIVGGAAAAAFIVFGGIDSFVQVFK